MPKRINFDEILECLENGVFILDGDLKVVYQEDKHRRIKGDHMGEVCFKAFQFRETKCEGCPAVLALNDGESQRAERLRVVDGVERCFEATSSPIRNKAGNIIAVINITREITGRSRSEKSLERAMRDWEDTFDTIEDLITLHDNDYNIIRANKAAREALGITEAQYGTIKCYKAYHGTDSIPEDCPSCNVLKKGQAVTIERFEPHLNMFVEVKAMPRFNGGDKPQGCLHIVRDITERKQMEDALKDSEEIHRTLFREASEAILIADMETGIILDANNRVETLLGYARDEIIGMDRKDIHPDDKSEEYTRNFKKGTPGEGMTSNNILLKRKDGIVVPVEISAAVTELMGKKVRIGIFRDITKRLEAKEALQKSEESLARAQEIAKIGNWEWDIASNELAWSREVYNLYGIDLKENPRHEMVIDALHPEYKDAFIKDIGEALNNQKTFEGEYRIIRPDGTERATYTKGEVTVDETGRPVKMFGIVQDITDRRRMESDLRETIAEKEMLIKEVHHRVKNNLSVIQSLLRLQAGQISDGRTRELFVESQNRVRSMSMIHERLHGSPDVTSLDFSEYVNSLAKRLFRSYETDSSRIKLITNLEEATIDVDTVIPCGLIVNELISNASKHAFPDAMKGEVLVEFKVTGKGEYLLSVKDNGIGISPDLDIENAETLGMQIITSLTKQVNGRLEVIRGEGTEVRIVFRDKSFKSPIGS